MNGHGHPVTSGRTEPSVGPQTPSGVSGATVSLAVATLAEERDIERARIAAAAELVRSSILLPCWCFDEALEYTGCCEKHRILTALGVNE